MVYIFSFVCFWFDGIGAEVPKAFKYSEGTIAEKLEKVIVTLYVSLIF